jgi:spore photoproduct lyase
MVETIVQELASKPSSTEWRDRRSRFVKLFDKTPSGVVCPHFYELVLSNGCPFSCSYCYLKLTFRGKKSPVLFTNKWEAVRTELEGTPSGVFSTGELADSLAVIPPLLEPTLDYFEGQKDRYLLLVTKSANTRVLRKRRPSPQIILSFSVNSVPASQSYEIGCPSPMSRLREAEAMKSLGWRVRIRLDPIILQAGIQPYKEICHLVRRIGAERITVGMLRQYPGLHRFAKDAPRLGLNRAADGRMRYSHTARVETYRLMAEWLCTHPALCKESAEVWSELGWQFSGCNCTVS